MDAAFHQSGYFIELSLKEEYIYIFYIYKFLVENTFVHVRSWLTDCV